MNTQAQTETNYQFSREEIQYLMDLLKAGGLFGIEREKLEKPSRSGAQNANPETIALSLEKKGILKQEGKREFILDSRVQPVMEALFFPDHALVVHRDRVGIGKQILYFLAKGKTIIMHSFPKEAEHFVALIPNPAAVMQMLLEWFPFRSLPITPARFTLRMSALDQIRFKAENGKTDEALKALDPTGLDPQEKEKLVGAFSDRIVSGSIAWLELESNTIKDSQSITVLTDGRTGWIISEGETAPPKEIMVTVRRIGADFSMTALQMAERLSGARIPRQVSHPSGKFTRFTINLDELAMALAAINCSDLSMKMYAALSDDLSGDQYPGRMEKAQRSLVESGLCAISPQGVPILNEIFAEAVFPIAKSDFMVEIRATGKNNRMDTGVNIVPGRFFTAYYNHGEYLQVLEYGKFEDLSLYIESFFPDFGTEKGIQKKSFSVIYEELEKAMKLAGEGQNPRKLPGSEGASEADARILLADLGNIFFRATLHRRDAPDYKKQALEKKENKLPDTLLLLKSEKRSWMFEFFGMEPSGKAVLTDREGFQKALSNLIRA